MPRAPRVSIGGMVYHVLNRANARRTLFDTDGDYLALLAVLDDAHRRVAMRTLAYCIMPNHWHLVLWPRADGDLSAFLRWMTMTHTQRWHAAHGTTGTGHLYQGRFKSFAVQRRRPSSASRAAGTVERADPLWTVVRYVERNALRARLVVQAEDWPWSSLHAWAHPGLAPAWWDASLLLRPTDWLRTVHHPQGEQELASVRRSVHRGAPFGSETWAEQTARRLGLESTLRPRGRPRKDAT